MRVKQSHITSHFYVLRLRSTIRLRHTIRSVATGTQWSRPMKSRIVFEFLFNRRTEIDRIRAFSHDQKADGMKSTPICLPHYSGGDNATKVRRRITCRNSFCDIFLHDPFAHHLKHALRLQVLQNKERNKNTRKKRTLVPELSAALHLSSRVPSQKQLGKQIPQRRSTDV